MSQTSSFELGFVKRQANGIAYQSVRLALFHLSLYVFLSCNTLCGEFDD